MERTINGHYRDPQSTRDITGITPHEFRVLIDLLREGIKCLDAFLTLPDDEFIQTYNAMYGIRLPESQAKLIKSQSKDDLYTGIQTFNTLNASYEGAKYRSKSGQIIYGGKGKLLNIQQFPGCEYYERLNAVEE